MASNKKGQFQKPSDFNKHLRKIGRRLFWKGERAKSKQKIKLSLKQA